MTKTEQKFLSNYNIHDYDIPLTSVDMAIFSLIKDQIHVLLVKRAQHPALGQWALPGGFIDVAKDQNLDDTARRKLLEKTAIDTSHLEQVASFGSKKRDPRGWSVTVAYFALIDSTDVAINSADNSSEEITWVPVTKASDYPLAFDHATILQACYERLQNKVQYTSLPVNLLPSEFTLSELQRLFELLLDKPIEKKSFRRRMADADILEETGQMRTGSNRPAKLYRVKPGGENYYFSRNIEGPR